jgi:AcrR family transcriptional regulator
MTPRRYDMSKRAEATQALRRRIVDATFELHTEQGIAGTSWRDIAERADVAVATVYNQFPSLDELVPACGERLMERLHPPSPADAADVIGDATTVEDRFGRVGVELYSFYERGGAHLDVFPGERELPAMQEWESYQLATVEAFVRAALQGHRPSPSKVRLICAFYDLTTFRSLQARGFGASSAARTMARVVSGVVETAGRSTTRRR